MDFMDYFASVGPALLLKIPMLLVWLAGIILAVLMIRRGTNTTTNERFLRRFHFKLPKQGGDQYIEPKKDKPCTIKLDFSHYDVPDSTKAAGVAEFSLTYYDVDGNLSRERRFHQLLEEAYLRETDGTETMPGDLDYPEELLSPPS